MIQSQKTQWKVRWHCFIRHHKMQIGWQHAVRLLFCECGFERPIVDNAPNPFVTKTLTNPEMKTLLDEMKKSKR